MSRTPNQENQLKENQRSLFLLMGIDTIGIVLLVFGIDALLISEGDAILPILNDRSFAIGALALGGLIMVGCGIKMLPILASMRENQ